MALLTGLQAYYQFQNNSNDVTGNGNNGTDTNITYGTGIIGQAAVFNGTSSVIGIGTGLNTKGGDMSVSAWCNLINYSADYRHILSKDITGTAASCVYDFYVQVTSGKLSFYNGSAEFPSAAVITTGSYQFIVFTFTNAGTMQVYVNGTLADTITGLAYGGGGATQNAQIGSSAPSASQVWNGSLDEIGVWNRVLTSTEITQLYNGGAGLTYPFTTAINPGFFRLIQ